MDFLAPLFLLLFLSACSSSSYLFEQGIGQWRLFNRARPVEEVLQNPTTPPVTKKAILTVLDAKRFSSQELGLKATKSYASFVPLEGDFVSWVVSAADTLKLEEKKWHFPFVGEVPYMGFFQKAGALEFAKKLEGENPKLDIWIRGVPAFSSLGWFPDPLYSSMIQGEEREIAETVIHESVHATAWVGDSVDFNERLANFVGLEGSVRYLAIKYPGGAESAAAIHAIEGEKIFGLFMHEAEARYRREVEPLATESVAAALAAKAKFYSDLSEMYDRYFAKLGKGGAEQMPVRFQRWNNAAFLSYGNYYSDYSVFEKMLARCGQDLARFIRWITGLHENSRQFARRPEKFLEEVVKTEACPA